jgi:catechol 2,3-dioxygenase-like lactoylglutathione lyase family enzyme
MERSLGFYRDLFEAEVWSDDVIVEADFAEMIGVPGASARIVNLVIGGQKVELISVTGVPVAPVPDRAPRGLSGFCFRVDDVDAAYARCLELGLELETEPTEISGFRQFVVTDPDGVRIELSEPPPHLEVEGPFSREEI